MNRDRYGRSILGENVVAAMNAVERPPGSLQLRDDFFASHILNDRSLVIYIQPANDRRTNRATRLDDLRIPPNNRLEALKRDRKGQHGIPINDQWRVCFRFEGGNTFDVEIVDYR